MKNNANNYKLTKDDKELFKACKLKEIIRSLKDSELKGNGTEKKCYIFKNPNYKDYVFLKYKNQYSSLLITAKENLYNSKDSEDVEIMKSVIEKINNTGITIPKTYFYCVINNDICELQQKIEGSQIFIANYCEFFKQIAEKSKIEIPNDKYLNDEEFLTSYFYSLSVDEKKFILDETINYNLKMLDQLQNATDEQWNKLISMYAKYYKHFGKVGLDNHSGNLLYSEVKGFNIIDLDYYELFFAEKKEKCENEDKPLDDNIEIAYSIVKPFLYGGLTYMLMEDLIDNPSNISKYSDYNIKYKNLINTLAEKMVNFKSDDKNICDVKFSYEDVQNAIKRYNIDYAFKFLKKKENLNNNKTLS